jgi:ABC-type sugar transport system ATPase subunit
LVMLIDEPTAGVDIGAAQKILGELRSLVTEGRSLVITTSELDDVIVVADRVVVLNGGRVSHELIRGRDEISEQSILSAMNQDTGLVPVAASSPSPRV